MRRRSQNADPHVSLPDQGGDPGDPLRLDEPGNPDGRTPVSASARGGVPRPARGGQPRRGADCASEGPSYPRSSSSWRAGFGRVSAGRAATAAAPLTPIGAGGSLAIPNWPEGLSAILNVEAVGGSDHDVDLRVARIAEGLLDAGILVSSDAGDFHLGDTIQMGLRRWLLEQFGGDLTTLDFLSLSFTDDVVESMKLSSEYGDGAQSWWGTYGPQREDYARIHAYPSNGPAPPLPAFAIRSGSHLVVPMKFWYRALRYDFGEGVATAVIGLLNDAVQVVGGWGFDYYMSDLEEAWDEPSENDEPDALNSESFHKHVPQHLCEARFKIDLLLSAAAGVSPHTRKVTERVLLAALRLAEETRCQEAAFNARPNGERNTSNQVGHFMHFLPPIALAWSGIHGDDPCIRLMDYGAEMIQCESHSDVCWLHGFDPDNTEPANAKGAIGTAINGLRDIVGILGPLDKLLTLLVEPAPKRPERRRMPQSARWEPLKPAAALIDMFSDRADTYRITEELETNLCAL